MQNLMIIVASTRPGRLGLPVAEWIRQVAEQRQVAERIDFADLKVIDLPFLDEPKHPRLKQYTQAHTFEWSRRVEAADGFLVVTPEYNYGLPAPLKNAIDFLNQEWAYKPVAFASYGGVSAGTRSVQMTKQVVTTLRMFPIVEAVQVPFVAQFMVDGVFRPNEVLEAAAGAMLDELARVAAALRPLRVPAARAG